MENKRSNISVVNLSGGYILPKVTETKGRKKHVELGIDGADDFFTTLIKRYETSPTNQACIDGSTDLIYGKGIKAKDRTRHVYVIGKTGMGKSTLMEQMIISDIYNGNGVGLVDPHGDFVEKILQGKEDIKE